VQFTFFSVDPGGKAITTISDSIEVIMKLAILSLTFALPALWGQIAQSRPEYCGIPGGVNPALPDLSANIDQEGQAVLYIGRGDSVPGIPLTLGGLPSSISGIAEVCPLSDGRLVVFGDYGGTAVYIAERTKPSVVDSFAAYHPVISPDQRWIAYVKAYPLHGVEGSDEYMIYDLTKTPAQNRPDGDANNSTDVGRVVFPPGHENFPGSNTQLPEDQRHLGGNRLYWSSDSRAILFEDRTASDRGIVLVTLDEKGTPTPSRHTLTLAEICGRNIGSGSLHTWRLERAEIGPDVTGSRAILVDLVSFGDNRCTPHVVQLHREDFQPSKTEVNGKPTYTRGAIVDGQEVIPPKRKK
jgi:hypothetical protein